MFVSKYGKIVGVATSAGEAATEGGEGMACGSFKEGKRPRRIS